MFLLVCSFPIKIQDFSFSLVLFNETLFVILLVYYTPYEEVSTMDWLLVQRSLTDCGASMCVI